MPVGIVLGELSGIRWIPAAWRGRLTGPPAACGCVPPVALALRPGIAGALTLLCATGLCGAYVLGLDQLLLDVTPRELFGRAYTVNSSVLMTTQGLGFAGAGAVAELLPPDIVIAGAGVAGLATVAVFGRRAVPVRPGSGAARGRRRAAR